MPVEVAEVAPRVMRDQFRALGSIESDEIIEVVSELNATVVELPFVEGQAVERGKLLAQLDDREFKAEADRGEARLDQARANFERARQLFDQGTSSQQQLDDASTALRVAEAEAALARARFEKTRIRAPFSGSVGRRLVSAGAYLRSGDVITTLARLDELKVSFSAPERFLGRLRPGLPVEVTTPAFPGATFEGRISVVDPMVDPRSRSVAMVARISNRGGRLRPGLSANVAATFSERSQALTLPDEAVFAEGDQSFVYVVRADSTVAKTAIVLGGRDSAMVEVIGGLEAGARVVRAGHQKLFEGARVMPLSAETMAQGGPGGARPPGARPDSARDGTAGR
jgi:membrane fusion protein (multidrug efflux system)